jgi:hypothetical protein
LLGASGDVDGTGLCGHGAAAQLGAQPFQKQCWLEAVELLKGGFDQTVRLAQQREQQVLGVELVVAKAKQELLDSGQSFARLFCKSFERDH